MVRILIVDDSDFLRMSLKESIGTDSMEVMEADSGPKALELLKDSKNPVDLVMTDYNMPEMDGISLAREIRKLENMENTPIIMLTTETSLELKTKGKSAGIQAWVTKPPNPEVLKAAIKTLCRS